MYTFVLLATMMAQTAPYGIDWAEGVVRLPAVQSGPREETWTTQWPGPERLVLMLWDALEHVPVAGGTTVADLFPAREDFDRVMRHAPGQLVDATLVLPLEGDDGLLMRLLQPHVFLPAEPAEAAPGSAPQDAAPDLEPAPVPTVAATEDDSGAAEPQEDLNALLDTGFYSALAAQQTPAGEAQTDLIAEAAPEPEPAPATPRARVALAGEIAIEPPAGLAMPPAFAPDPRREGPSAREDETRRP